MREMNTASLRVLLPALLALFLGACQTAPKLDPALASEAQYAVASAKGNSSKGAAVAEQPSQDGTRPFIEFRSRYALSYGHTFVVFGRLNGRGEMIDPEVAGLAPKSHAEAMYTVGHFVPVPSSTGWTDGDLEDEYISANWRVMLSEAEYKDTVAKIRKLQASSPVWHAALYNCNAFVGDIARSMGYRVPFHLLMPQEFVTTLREMNGGAKARRSTLQLANTAR